MYVFQDIVFQDYKMAVHLKIYIHTMINNTSEKFTNSFTYKKNDKTVLLKGPIQGQLPSISIQFVG